ncbi:Scr1 family TA system antitoxin-like transcriptional regulator [Actinoallomurus purpureus]|uniref:helix-turn-helix domain-containing protein n=1 Tax=Actinoallomurus purpureus TaxID=478114 RepID=UPI00209329BD|nr:Scr1 family TA system antitoxin-like transcriptional regulator [Actinoallomurus purpureus]MCO6005774.1 Scr1 family TA system antitoxin-like transcriptional regulator [Actinoallomurus purpureus]
MTARVFVAKELRRAREAKWLTRATVGKSLYVSDSLVAAWETHRMLPRPEHLERLLPMLGVSDILVRVIDELVAGEVPPEWLDKWLVVERRATSLLSFQSTVVPGLLQNQEYARAVLRAGRHDIADLEDMVGARLDRQKILTREDAPPVLVAVIAESVLGQNVGGAKVMADQLMYLAAMAERDNVVVQIVPAEAEACAGFTGPFAVATLDGGIELAYVDSQLSGEVVERQHDVAMLRRMFEVFRADTLPRRQSIELIRRKSEQWTT